MLDDLAERVLAAVDRAAPELRYEEKSWQGYDGTNVVLRQLLGARQCDVPYSMGGGNCDLVVDVDGTTTWIEVKQAWTWKTFTNPAGRNSNYHKHLFGETASALHDARDRLPRLVGRPEAQVIGLLVIGLDSDQLPLPLGDLDTLAERAGLALRPWRRFSRSRRRSQQTNFASIGVHAHLWLRETSELVGVCSATDRASSSAGGQS